MASLGRRVAGVGRHYVRVAGYMVIFKSSKVMLHVNPVKALFSSYFTRFIPIVGSLRAAVSLDRAPTAPLRP